jgi:2,5-diketo-D-gluconate reductase A
MTETLTLNNSQMPLVGFGTYLISNDDAESVISMAFDLGYRHIDTAQGYFNEEGIGNAVENALTMGTFSREKLFITTKLWPGNEAWGESAKGYAESIEAFNASLTKLKVDYIDLYLIHAPFAKDQRLEQWKALIHLQEIGKVKHIGVCNYNISHLEEIKSAGLISPQLNQVELHPWSQKPELISYMRQNSINPMAYSSLVPLSTWRDSPGQDSSKTEEMKTEGKTHHSLFKLAAEKYAVSEAQILLRWAVQQNIPVIPKSISRERMKLNLEVFCFELDEEEMNAFRALDKGKSVAWATGDPADCDQ